MSFARGASAVLLPAVLCLVVPSAASAQEPTLGAVLTRAAAYVADFQRLLSGIVADESYLQQINSGAGGPLQRVRLTSDVLLVRPPGADHYVQFRDVFAVNGASVRDREERLTRLFLDLPARGRLWVEPDSGRVLMTELVAEDANVRGVVEVSYEVEPAIGLLVPVAMRDRYEHVSGATRVDGYATYSRFRRFDVTTTERIGTP